MHRRITTGLTASALAVGGLGIAAPAAQAGVPETALIKTCEAHGGTVALLASPGLRCTFEGETEAEAKANSEQWQFVVGKLPGWAVARTSGSDTNPPSFSVSVSPYSVSTGGSGGEDRP